MTSWPDWTGQAVAIIASGPSTKKEDVATLKGRLPVLAIKRNVELAPWADVVYGCDFAWWRSVRGLPEYKGLKAAYAPRAVQEYGCAPVLIPGHEKSDHLLFDQAGTVGAGGCSGFQALNLAVQFGATRVLLLGFDCQNRSGFHWYGRNTSPGMANPDEINFTRWRRAFANAATQLEQRGVEVINASAISDIKSFKKTTVEGALLDWGI